MFANRIVWVAVVALGLIVVGCKKEEPAPPVTPQDKTPAVDTSAAKKTVDDTKTAVKDATAAASDKAKDMLAKVQSAIDGKNWADADKWLAELDQIKGSLSVEWQSKIDAAKSALTAAKAAGALPTTVPAIPGLK